jgi:hypothetical protein
VDNDETTTDAAKGEDGAKQTHVPLLGVLVHRVLSRKRDKVDAAVIKGVVEPVAKRKINQSVLSR